MLDAPDLTSDLSAAAATSTGLTSLRRLPRAGRFILRCRGRVIEAAGRAFGTPLPQARCRASNEAGRAALWLGPDEWLLLLPDRETEQCAAVLERALIGSPHSLVEVSDRQCAFEVIGPHAATVLNTGCPLDLDLSAFPAGMCTRTVLGKTQIVLWRVAARQFHVEVWRSFADYAIALLEEGMREFQVCESPRFGVA